MVTEIIYEGFGAEGWTGEIAYVFIFYYPARVCASGVK